MKYTVYVDENARSITVTLPDGSTGVARCCPTDQFDITAGTLLALERAKIESQVNATAPKSAPKSATPKSVLELVRELEKALPKGQMVVVGNGKEMTAEQKKWLATLAGVSTKPCCPYCEEGECGYDMAYNDGYQDGYADAEASCDSPADSADSADSTDEDKVAAAIHLAILHALGLI